MPFRYMLVQAGRLRAGKTFLEFPAVETGVLLYIYNKIMYL